MTSVQLSKRTTRPTRFTRYSRHTRAVIARAIEYRIRKSLCEYVIDELDQYSRQLFYQRVSILAKNASIENIPPSPYEKGISKQVPKEDVKHTKRGSKESLRFDRREGSKLELKETSKVDLKEGKEDFKSIVQKRLEKIIEICDSITFTSDDLTGLFLCMGDYTLLVIEGSEDMLGIFFEQLKKQAEKLWVTNRVFLVEDKIEKISIATLVEGSWGAPGNGQYHIQTDEGPERYFRFQTDNGQFRKEKRLQDGTVIGTEAWIDAAGYLRQKDYIADTKGYRILKSKTVFVGQGRPIEDAIKSTKSAPAQSGVLVAGINGANSLEHVSQHKHEGYVYSTTAIPATTRPTPSYTKTTTAAPQRGKLDYLSPAEAAKIEPSPYLGYDHYPDELPHRSQRPQPVVLVRPHSEPIDDFSNHHQQEHDFYAATALPLPPPMPSISMQPPLPNNYRRVRPIAVVSSTPAPITANEATPAPIHNRGYSSPAPFGTTPAPGYYYEPHDDDYDGASHQRGGSENINARAPPAVLPLDVNNLEALQPPYLPTHFRSPRPQAPLVQSNTLGSGYEQPNADYDGVAITRNGFRYFLPRQYHEEEEVGEQKRAGSFGYIDPFGIRRVIYYNASPERGFVQRKNNRYVGFGATPYDPRPY